MEVQPGERNQIISTGRFRDSPCKRSFLQLSISPQRVLSPCSRQHSQGEVEQSQLRRTHQCVRRSGTSFSLQHRVCLNVGYWWKEWGTEGLALLLSIRTATKRGGGSTKNGRDSAGRRLGVKKYGGELQTIFLSNDTTLQIPHGPRCPQNPSPYLRDTAQRYRLTFRRIRRTRKHYRPSTRSQIPPRSSRSNGTRPYPRRYPTRLLVLLRTRNPLSSSTRIETSTS